MLHFFLVGFFHIYNIYEAVFLCIYYVNKWCGLILWSREFQKLTTTWPRIPTEITGQRNASQFTVDWRHRFLTHLRSVFFCKSTMWTNARHFNLHLRNLIGRIVLQNVIDLFTMQTHTSSIRITHIRSLHIYHSHILFIYFFVVRRGFFPLFILMAFFFVRFRWYSGWLGMKRVYAILRTPVARSIFSASPIDCIRIGCFFSLLDLSSPPPIRIYLQMNGSKMKTKSKTNIARNCFFFHSRWHFPWQKLHAHEWARCLPNLFRSE